MKINIGWLYPDLMNTYGDRGNIIALSHRAKMMGIKSAVNKISINEPGDLILKMDILFMGGAQDKQQEIVNQDLKNKGLFLKKAINDGVPGLYVCGAYQFLGKYYKEADGKIIDGIGVFDLYTESSKFGDPRCIGNIVIESTLFPKIKLVGFENHGGRTYLADKKQAFATVFKGYGNNGEDKTEGIYFKNSFGTYLHGPILPKNPEIADYLIEKALERKYRNVGVERDRPLKKINNSWEEKARSWVIDRL
ncbi:glutamine amidotransferase [Candidatus Roizmanbacteria bacterium CG_4_9_14_3_um_filter_33_18]|uniref:Lipid II isoglutaminyl synthase (glutamine-hydrolyzing) subunit GatD n=2 Tax=Candidatus Roizmaniibacteriota TaxID=1752723 RepID=A0A2M7XXW4_9BACT|nr:MAG: glutamine amidotransferase [Candidatus Roizmanbacteria bacterium CG22_combo_CG10-13_8_21_14_all_34_12]PJA55563.1 MAG: glutamine amidotransferase [Candidatus Roizmanbacteria bacterium CG_4_9_14_3_um_filter_33_18]